LSEFWINLLYSAFPNFVVKWGAEASIVRKITTWSKRLRRYLLGLGVNSNKIEVVSSGVDTSRFDPTMFADMRNRKNEMGMEKKDFIILYFGPLSKFRGADTAILAFHKIVKKIPQAKLLLLSRKPSNLESENSKLEKMARKNRRIRLIEGIQSAEKVTEYLAISDVILLPFRFWPHIDCPLTVLEAMALAKPVISTSTGVIPEIIENGKTGILVPPGRPENISAAVLKLARDLELRECIGKEARKYVVRFHDWNVIAKKTWNILKGL